MPAIVLGTSAPTTRAETIGYRSDGSPIYSGRVTVIEEKPLNLPPPPPVVTSLPPPGPTAQTVALWNEKGELEEVTVPAAPPVPERDWQADVRALTPEPKKVIVTDAVKETFETADAIYVKAPPKQDMGLFSNLANKIIDNVVDKTLSQTTLTQAQKDAAIEQFDEAREVSGVNKKIDTFDKIVTTVGTAGVAVGSALLPGISSVLGSNVAPKKSGPLAVESTRAQSYGQTNDDGVPGWMWLALIPVALFFMGKRKFF